MHVQKLTLRNIDWRKKIVITSSGLQCTISFQFQITESRLKSKGMTWKVYWPTLSTPYLCPATWWESGTHPFRWALCAPSGKHEPRVINGRASSSLPSDTEESIMMLRPKNSLQWLFISLNNCLHTKSHIDRTTLDASSWCVWPIACHQSRRPRSQPYNELFTWATSHFLTSEMFTLLPR